MKIIKRDVAEILADLPEMCAARLPSNNSAILIKRGTAGYWSRPGLDVEAFNARHNVTPAQVAAMMAGSMFGFDCPGADPLNNAPRREHPGVFTSVDRRWEDR